VSGDKAYVIAMAPGMGDVAKEVKLDYFFSRKKKRCAILRNIVGIVDNILFLFNVSWSVHLHIFQ
jgi:hypothetical protein